VISLRGHTFAIGPGDTALVHVSVHPCDTTMRGHAHVFHRESTICTGTTFPTLPRAVQLGVLAEETGHLLLGPGASERDLSRIIRARFGVPWNYRATVHGRLPVADTRRRTLRRHPCTCCGAKTRRGLCDLCLVGRCPNVRTH